MSVDEALLILQRHERARQGRLRAKLMEDIRRQEAAAAEKGKVVEQSLSLVLAANRIQKMWRGALARRKVRKLREEELAFIGMVRLLVCYSNRVALCVCHYGLLASWRTGGAREFQTTKRIHNVLADPA